MQNNLDGLKIFQEIISRYVRAEEFIRQNVEILKELHSNQFDTKKQLELLKKLTKIEGDFSETVNNYTEKDLSMLRSLGFAIKQSTESDIEEKILLLKHFLTQYNANKELKNTATIQSLKKKLIKGNFIEKVEANSFKVNGRNKAFIAKKENSGKEDRDGKEWYVKNDDKNQILGAEIMRFFLDQTPKV